MFVQQKAIEEEWSELQSQLDDSKSQRPSSSSSSNNNNQPKKSVSPVPPDAGIQILAYICQSALIVLTNS
jgi:hypothetical protein